MAAHIPKEFIDQVISQSDIVELVDSFVPLKKIGTNYKACCPFHDEKSPSFVVSSDKQIYHCFGCGVGGNVISFLMDYEHLSFIDTVTYLAKNLSLPIPLQQREKSDKHAADFHQIMQEAVTFYQQQLKSTQATPAKNYLIKRELSGELAKQFHIGFAPNGWNHLGQHLKKKYPLSALEKVGLIIQKPDGQHYDRFRDRIIYPIRDRQGRFIGLGGRIIDQGEPKYLNSPETPIFHKSRELYGFYEMVKTVRAPDYIIIVEGYMDVLALVQHGIPQVVGTLGTATTDQHITTLFRYTDELVFCFDGDLAGKKAAWRALSTLMPALQDGKTLRFMFLPDGQDPDSYIRAHGQAGFEQAKSQSNTLAEFLINHLTNLSNMNQADGRAKFSKAASDLIALMPDIHFKQILINEIAGKARLNPDQLKTMLEKPNTQPLNRPFITQKMLSPVRHAIALALQYPQLASSAQQTLPNLSPGHQFLQSLLELLRENPHINTAGILESYREQKGYRELVQLASQPLLTPADGVEKEFNDSIAKLCAESQTLRIDELFAKASKGLLPDDERQELQHLLTQRATSTTET